jgi:Na+-driven multidrug efflux pump
VLTTVASAWWLLATTHVMSGTSFALDGVFMGAEDYRYLRNLTAFAALLAGGIAQILASQGGTIVGIWWCVNLMMAIRVAAHLRRLSSQRWVDASR